MTRITDTSPMDLPRAVPQDDNYPTRDPKYVNVLARLWEKGYDDEEGFGRERAIPEAGPYRGSLASVRCDRQLHYSLTQVPCDMGHHNEDGLLERAATPDEVDAGFELGVYIGECPKCKGSGVMDLPKSNPSTIADKWRFKLGKIVHDAIESLLPVAFPNALAEVVVDLNKIGIPGSAHADMVDNGDEVVEWKSVNGFKYKMQTTNFKSPPEGPSFGAILQAAMVARALGIRKVTAASLSLENMAASFVKDVPEELRELSRFAAEWPYDMDELDEAVDYEVKRVNRVLKFQGGEVLPARELHDPSIPRGAVVTDPTRGVWNVTVGGELKGQATTWYCSYCPQRDRCIGDGAS